VVSRTLKKSLVIVGIIVAVLVIFQIVSAFYFVSENLLFTNRSAAMEPTIKINDVLVVDTSVPFDTLQIDDIIAFHPPYDLDRTIVMRILEKIDDEPLTFKTKGDANQGPIPETDFPIKEENYVGKVSEIISQ
jgi:signal peptidase